MNEMPLLGVEFDGKYFFVGSFRGNSFSGSVMNMVDMISVAAIRQNLKKTIYLRTVMPEMDSLFWSPKFLESISGCLLMTIIRSRTHEQRL